MEPENNKRRHSLAVRNGPRISGCPRAPPGNCFATASAAPHPQP